MFVAILVIILLGCVAALGVILVRNNRNKMAARGGYPVWQRRALRRQSARDSRQQEPSIGKIKTYNDDAIGRETKAEHAEDSDSILGLKPNAQQQPIVTTQSSASTSPLPISSEYQIQPALAVEPSSASEQSGPQLTLTGKRIMLCLKAKKNCLYGGYELLQSLLANGFRFGEMDLFHRHQQKTGHGPILFSLAATTATGVFDLAKIGGFSCPGLSLFFYLDGQADPSHSFDLMLKTAEQLVDDLGGELLDEQQQVLTPTTIRRLQDELSGIEKRMYTPDMFADEPQQV